LFPADWGGNDDFLIFSHWWDLRQIVAHAAVLLAASLAVLKLAALRLEKGFMK